MNLSEQVTADQASLVEIEASLETARQKLAEDQALLAAAQPHLTALDSLKAFVSEKFPELESDVTAFSEKIKGLV